jgi:hypothetical protein
MNLIDLYWVFPFDSSAKIYVIKRVLMFMRDDDARGFFKDKEKKNEICIIAFDVCEWAICLG